MALYQVVLESVVLDDASNPQINSFFYNVSDILPSSIAAVNLADAFYDNVLNGAGGIKFAVQTNTDFDRIVVTSPFSPVVLGIKSIAATGQRTGSQMPRFVAWQFKSERTRADIRAGFKRFGAVSETDTSGDVPTVGMLTVLNGVASLLGATLNFDGDLGAVFGTPVIVKRIPVVVGGVTVGYRLPTDDSELEYSVADAWAYHSITTQNSRKK